MSSLVRSVRLKGSEKYGRWGELIFQDFIGIDVNFATTESLHDGFFGDPRFRPHYFQQRMLQSGRLGRKSGGGYYDYEQ
ncbi:3-hydroxyacyl-CoA dehydrogenase family protein [Paenibacillus xerothermodurans]|uniref:3-hydroxyacyl-CoA dehydrogenase family protein n=1 Tax=Paenibacillus xerothermodurans TaxID=1977292 RepID=UPI001FB2D312|nr:3-hydroxyacyl-CoA dehydrogenase family protein [Paenibacillus xerothermodurans]